MSLPLDCKPRLSQGCNLSEDANQSPVILIPEGIIKLKGTSLEILKCCDGTQTLSQIIDTLQKKYKMETDTLAKEVQAFLSKLVEKKIVTLQ
jgi:coenzyme PQQ biosynthesis protein PqqD